MTTLVEPKHNGIIHDLIREIVGDNDDDLMARGAIQDGIHAVLDDFVTTELHNSEGWLTIYGLSCGYIEKRDEGPVSTQLWLEGACLHVRQHDHSEAGRKRYRHTHVEGRVFWESYELHELAKARRVFATGDYEV